MNLKKSLPKVPKPLVKTRSFTTFAPESWQSGRLRQS
jgi:hypothetical protein